MSLDQEVRRRLEDALAGADSWFAVYGRLRDAFAEGEVDRYRALVWAFGYDLISPTAVERREREGSPFGALSEFHTGRLPPRLGDVPDEDVEVWVDAFDEIDDPRLLGDLLWERRVQPRHDLKAREACAALLSLANDAAWGDMESTEGLVWALELARAVSDEQLEQRVVDQSVAAIESQLDRDDERPGVSYTLLRALADLPAKRRPPQLRDLVERTESVYGDDPYHQGCPLALNEQTTAKSPAGVSAPVEN